MNTNVIKRLLDADDTCKELLINTLRIRDSFLEGSINESEFKRLYGELLDRYINKRLEERAVK